MRAAFIIGAALLVAPAHAEDAVPLLADLGKTPGPANPALDQATVCHVCVCHDLSLAEAQEMIRANWIKARARYVTPKGTKMCATNAEPASNP